MAADIDKLLEPGERVVHEVEWGFGFLLPPRWQRGLIALAAVVAVLTMNGLVGLEGRQLAALAAVLAAFWLPGLSNYVKQATVEGAVTDHRVILARQGAELEVTEAPLAEIERLERVGPILRATKSDGRSVLLYHSHRASELARALARATGLPEPPPGEETLAEAATELGGLVTGLAVLLAVINLPIALPGAEGGVLSAFDLTLLALAGFFAGRLLGRLLGLCMLLPRLGHREMHRWIRDSDLFSSNPGAPAKADRRARRFLHIACRLQRGSLPRLGRRAAKGGVLDAMLEPGEQVLFRAPAKWHCAAWPETTAILCFGFGLPAAFGLVTFDAPGLVALAAIAAPLLVLTAWDYPRSATTEALVTERRLLHRYGGFAPRITTLPVAAISGVKAVKHKVRVTKRDGTAATFEHPQLAWGLGVALAHAAGAPPPRLPPRREIHAEDLWTACVVAITVALGLSALKGLYLCCGAAIFGFSLLGGGALFLLGGLLAALPGMALGGPLCLLLLRPFFTYEAQRDWIDHWDMFWAQTQAENESDWQRDLHRAIVDLLYGRRRAGAKRRAAERARDREAGTMKDAEDGAESDD